MDKNHNKLLHIVGILVELLFNIYLMLRIFLEASTLNGR